MCSVDIKTVSDETDMFNLVLHKFKEEHFTLEEKRKYPVYGTTPQEDQGKLLLIYQRYTGCPIKIYPISDNAKKSNIKSIRLYLFYHVFLT